MVVEADPVCHDVTGVLQGLEPVSVHTLIFERSDHALDHAVLLRAVRGEPASGAPLCGATWASLAKLLHRQPEGFDVGALERRLDASPDRPTVLPASHLDPKHLGENWWHQATAAMPVRDGVDLCRERRNIAGRRCRRIDSVDRCTPWPGAVDNQS